jgi:signal peptidase I
MARTSPIETLYSLLKGYFFAIVGAATVAFMLRVYVLEAFRIPTDFMSPALVSGDHIFVYKLAYKTKLKFLSPKPERGDVVVLSFPNDPTKDFIKRIIAIPGDIVEIRNGAVIINGNSIGTAIERPGVAQGDVFVEHAGDHRYEALWNNSSADARKMIPITVPDKHVFVLGDNRAKGQDSRTWGFIPIDYLQGKAFLIWFSANFEEEKSSPGIRWDRVFKGI